MFVWRVRHGRILVLDHMGINLYDTLGPCCNETVESTCHFFVSCKKVRNFGITYLSGGDLGRCNLGYMARYLVTRDHNRFLI